MGLGCIAGLSTLPSVNAPRLLGNSTALAKMDRHTRKGELSKKLWHNSDVQKCNVWTDYFLINCICEVRKKFFSNVSIQSDYRLQYVVIAM